MAKTGTENTDIIKFFLFTLQPKKKKKSGMLLLLRGVFSPQNRRKLSSTDAFAKIRKAGCNFNYCMCNQLMSHHVLGIMLRYCI